MGISLANGTANGTASKAPQNESNDLAPDVHNQMRLDRCTHAEWDKQKGVPFENPVADNDLSNGTSTEDSRVDDLDGLEVRQPLSWDDVLGL